MANSVTLFRVLLTFLALLVVKIDIFWNATATVLLIISMLLDALDGFIARWFNKTSLAGSIYDILADRIIENACFIYFAANQLFSVWAAIFILTRGLLIDAVRTLFLIEGRTAFGTNTLQQSEWAKQLACSRLSRGTYNMLKLVTFMLFASLIMPQGYVFYYVIPDRISLIAHICLWCTVVLAILRAIPVIFDGWLRYRPSC